MSQPDPPSIRRASRWMPWLALLAIAVLGSAARFHDIGGQSFWIDEFFALQHSAGWGESHALYAVDQIADMPADFTSVNGYRPLDIWRGVRRDTHPPLYFILLGAWRAVFGDGASAARSLSAVFSLVALGAVVAAVREQAGWRPALWTGAILAASGVQVRFAQEARNYTMLLAIVYVMLWIILRADRRRSLTLTSTTTLAGLFFAAMLTHYLAVVPLAALATYAMLRLDRQGRQRIALSVASAAILFVIVWLPSLVDQYRHDMLAKMRWMGSDPSHGPADVFFALLAWPWDGLLDDVRSPPLARYTFGIVVGLILIMTWRAHRRALPWMLLCVTTLGYLAIRDMIENTHSLVVTRYTLVAAPALCAWLCLAGERWLWSRHFVPMLWLAVCLFHIEGPYRNRKADWRPLVSWLTERAGPGDVIIFTGPEDKLWLTQNSLLAVLHYGGWTQENAPRVLVLSRAPSQRMLDTIRSVDEVLIVHAAIGAPPADWFAPDRLDPGEMAFPIATAHKLVRASTTAPTTINAATRDARPLSRSH